jgi:hypothetical protein
LQLSAALLFAVGCLGILWQKGMPLCGVGNGGDFLVPLLLATLWGVDRRSPWIIGTTLFIAAGTYPSAFLICITVTFLAMFQRDATHPLIESEALIGLIVGFASICIFRSSILVADPDPLIGTMRSAQEMVMDPIFHQGGRHPIWMGNWFPTILIGYQGGLSFRAGHFILVLALLILFVIRRNKFGPLHPALWRLFLASISLFILAWAFLPMLFYPSRYVRGAMPIFLIGALITGLGNWIYDKKRKWPVIVASALLLMFLVPFFFGRYRYAHPRDPEIFKVISELPTKAFLAGHPRQMDDVVYFGRRSVLTSDESLMPVFDAFHLHHSERMKDLFQALYSDREEKVLEFCRKYDVTHLLLDRGLYVLEKEGGYLPYVKPYGNYARTQALLHYNRWVLNKDHFPGELFRSKYQVLAPCRREALFGPTTSESHP